MHDYVDGKDVSLLHFGEDKINGLQLILELNQQGWSNKDIEIYSDVSSCYISQVLSKYKIKSNTSKKIPKYSKFQKKYDRLQTLKKKI